MDDTFIATESEQVEIPAKDVEAVTGLMNQMFPSGSGEQKSEPAPNASTPSTTEASSQQASSQQASPDATQQEGVPGIVPETTANQSSAQVKVEPSQQQQQQQQQQQASPALDDIDAIQQPRGLNPANQENWKALKQKAKQYKKELESLSLQRMQEQRELAALKQQVTSVPSHEEIEELRKFRRAFDIKSDPAFNKQFDDKFLKNDEDIYKLMQWRGADSQNVEKLKKQGGVSSLPQEWWEENVIEPLRKSSSPEDQQAAKMIEAKLNERAMIAWEKEMALNEASDLGSKFMQEQMQRREFAQKYELDVIQNRVAELQKELPWLREETIPADATPEQKAQIEKANARYKKLESIFLSALYPKDPETKVETATAACMAVELMDRWTETQNQLKLALEENAKLKNAGKTSSSGRAAPIASGKKQQVDLLKMSNEDAIKYQMEQMLNGQ